MYSARGFGPRQLELLNWFVENPTAECTTTEMYKLNVCKLPERAQKRFIDAQSFVSDRLRSLVERGLLQRRRTTNNGRSEYRYSYAGTKHQSRNASKPTPQVVPAKPAEISVTLSTGKTLTGSEVKELLAFLGRHE